jgi:FAD/FMN-containing dehydrogenase
MNAEPAIGELAALVGAAAVSQDPSDLQHWGRDWTRVHEPRPWAICWPRDTAEVAAVLRWCHANRVAVVPSGGRTGLAGGAVAAAGELVLSLDRLRDLAPVDAVGRTVQVGAGVPNQLLQDHCAPHGLWWPVDLAAKGSATIGGNLATNAGGLRVVRYGHARKWLLGLEAVTAAGEVISGLRALPKDNCGPDLGQLLVGSEGTLAVITAAVLQLTALPGPTAVALMACADATAVLGVLASVRHARLDLHAFEMFSDLCLTHVLRHTGLPAPLGTRQPLYALVEVGLEAGGQQALEHWLETAMADGMAVDGALAGDRREAARLWAYRERITESLQEFSPRKNDVSVPVARLPQLLAELDRWLAQSRPGWEVALFGHVGDGNVHLNALRPRDMPMAEFQAACDEADGQLYEIVARMGGSVSAEHGIGLIKRRWLPLVRSPQEIDTLRAIKRAMDPQGLLNPGKLLP